MMLFRIFYKMMFLSLDPLVSGALIGAGGSLLGGVMNLFGSKKANNQADRQFEESNRLQREFAQNSIQWRAEDAKKAGLSPMAALGVNASSYTPSASAGFNEMSSIAGGVADSANAIGRSLQMLALAKNESEIRAIDSQTQKNEAEAQLAVAKAQDVTKTNRDFNKMVTTAKNSEVYFGDKSKPNFELLPITKGRFRVDFAEGSTDSERAGEGGLINAHFMYSKMAGAARQAAKDASKTYGGSWYAHQNVDGSWEIIRRDEKYHSPVEFFSDYYERFVN